MRSSPSDSGAEDNADLFPATNDPSTPTQDPRRSAPSPEPSPPTSQDPPLSGDGDAAMNLGSEEPAMGAMFGGTGEGDRSINGTQMLRGKGDERNIPGGTWKNKRAQEEYQRAMEAVIDKDFNLRKSRCA